MGNTVKLDHPVRIESENRELTEITLRRPKVSDAKQARKGRTDDADQEIALIANLASLPPSVIEDLDMSDYSKLQKVLAGFFG